MALNPATGQKLTEFFNTTRPETAMSTETGFLGDSAAEQGPIQVGNNGNNGSGQEGLGSGGPNRNSEGSTGTVAPQTPPVNIQQGPEAMGQAPGPSSQQASYPVMSGGGGFLGGFSGGVAPGPTETINLADIAKRTVDAPTETVEGRMTRMLDQNSDWLEGFRDRAQRLSNRRGLVNSSIAASAGEEVAQNAAFNVASTDAATYGKAADYNVAAENQGRMFNVEQLNKMSAEQLAAETSRYTAQVGASASAANAAASAAASKYASDIRLIESREGLSAQERQNLRNDVTRRYEIDQNRATQQERDSNSYRNNITQAILNNNDMPPEVRSRLLRSMGQPELADAIYIAGDEEDAAPTSGGSSMLRN